ncbi:hypothetical protein BJ987_002500 [Nocardia goodfellowii]|uniref:Uncharacterized protein n=1 Tax=Nocardia goodfellowii TaxID=882446 RepID=A0ABS4QD38_9NOCA|nr:hypothetical protein [Nocardia goodfellowii]
MTGRELGVGLRDDIVSADPCLAAATAEPRHRHALAYVNDSTGHYTAILGIRLPAGPPRQGIRPQPAPGG